MKYVLYANEYYKTANNKWSLVNYSERTFENKKELNFFLDKRREYLNEEYGKHWKMKVHTYKVVPHKSETIKP